LALVALLRLRYQLVSFGYVFVYAVYVTVSAVGYRFTRCVGLRWRLRCVALRLPRLRCVGYTLLRLNAFAVALPRVTFGLFAVHVAVRYPFVGLPRLVTLRLALRYPGLRVAGLHLRWFALVGWFTVNGLDLLRCHPSTVTVVHPLLVCFVL